MYIVLALILLVWGALEGVVMRTQQADGLQRFLRRPLRQLFSTRHHHDLSMAMPFSPLINIVVRADRRTRYRFSMLNPLSPKPDAFQRCW
jgi:hypothetical protein